LPPEKFIARIIARCSMLPAIDFDDQPRRDTGEIREIGRDRVLAAKAPAKFIIAEIIPESPFRLGRRLAKRARA
jgi:hypothetical protein